MIDVLFTVRHGTAHYRDASHVRRISVEIDRRSSSLQLRRTVHGGGPSILLSSSYPNTAANVMK
jgi:hypothetical protein